MAAKKTEAVFLGFKINGVMYQIDDEDMPEKASPWKALLKVYERKKLMAESESTG